MCLAASALGAASLLSWCCPRVRVLPRCGDCCKPKSRHLDFQQHRCPCVEPPVRRCLPPPITQHLPLCHPRACNPGTPRVKPLREQADGGHRRGVSRPRGTYAWPSKHALVKIPYRESGSTWTAGIGCFSVCATKDLYRGQCLSTARGSICICHTHAPTATVTRRSGRNGTMRCLARSLHLPLERLGAL